MDKYIEIDSHGNIVNPLPVMTTVQKIVEEEKEEEEEEEKEEEEEEEKEEEKEKEEKDEDDNEDDNEEDKVEDITDMFFDDKEEEENDDEDDEEEEEKEEDSEEEDEKQTKKSKSINIPVSHVDIEKYQKLINEQKAYVETIEKENIDMSLLSTCISPFLANWSVLVYDPNKRDPAYSNSNNTKTYELILLSKHYHPSGISWEPSLNESSGQIRFYSSSWSIHCLW